jgi:4'-phosphopantetheinyl transferase
MCEALAVNGALTDIEEGSLYLWCAHPQDLSTEAAIQSCEAMLNEGERIRWRGFRLERHRCEYLTTRALVRTALSQYFPIAPEEWRFQVNAFGKPGVEPATGLRFNLSNSPGLVVCLIAKGVEVGVDVEPHERSAEIAEVATQFLSPRELAQFEALQGGDRLDRALTLWTLKEAYIKARGMGLSLPLKGISFVFGSEEEIRLELDAERSNAPPVDWRFGLLDYAGHRIALAVEGAALAELQIWSARPVLAPAVRLPDGGVRWFPAQ